MKIPHIVLERWAMCFSSHKNCGLKGKLWWDVTRERKSSAFFVTFILSKHFFSLEHKKKLKIRRKMKFYVISRTPQGSIKGHNKVAGSYQAIAWAML